jgi:hypothetical protein
VRPILPTLSTKSCPTTSALTPVWHSLANISSALILMHLSIKPSRFALVGRTYVGVDGYCPFALYLGSLGYCLELALRRSVQLSAAESGYNFERALPLAARLVATPLLVRADSSFCSLKLMQESRHRPCRPA